MAEQPPLNRFYVASYAANDRDFPIVAIRLDPRVAGYRVPEDLSPHPDSKRYPNHVFTGSEPSNGDERVTHIYEILPSPWVPFTRYDDDLGPVQGRRRFVKNEGQQASLTSSTKISYEGREGSAIVSNEIEETWSIAVDEDGNFLFPIKDRDFYDASRGPVQERRQLFVPTGEEKGSLENIDGVITQTSYEPYNEFLSVKIVQTYSVNGPQLIGKTTNSSGQFATVTAQRKAADGYVPPNPTATRTVDISREDAESLIETLTDVQNVFDEKILSTQRPDVVPERFRAKIPNETTSFVEEGQAQSPSLGENEFEATEQNATAHTVKKTSVKRSSSNFEELVGKEYEEQFNIQVPFTEKISNTSESIASSEVTPIGDDKYVIREYDQSELEGVLEDFNKVYPVSINLEIPRVLKSLTITTDNDRSLSTTNEEPWRLYGAIEGSFEVSRTPTVVLTKSVIPVVNLDFETIWGRGLRAEKHIFFLKEPTEEEIKRKTGAIGFWPTFKTTSKSLKIFGKRISKRLQLNMSRSYRTTDGAAGVIENISRAADESVDTLVVDVDIPPCVSAGFFINQLISPAAETIYAEASLFGYSFNGIEIAPEVSRNINTILDFQENGRNMYVNFTLPASSPPTVPRSGIYIIDTAVEFYKYGWFLVTATVFNASQLQS